jgi:hypothetical protein
MIFIRITGVLLLAFSGAFGARMINMRESSALVQNEGFIAFIRMAKGKIERFSMPLPQIFSECPSEIYRECGYVGECPTCVSHFFNGCRVCDGVSHKIFSQFCKEIGRGYRNEQIRVCEYYLTLLEDRRNALSKALPNRKKRIRTLFLSGALAAAILLV